MAKGGTVTIEHSNTRPHWSRVGCAGCGDKTPQMILIRVKHGRSLEDDKVTLTCRQCSSNNPKWERFDNSERDRMSREAKEKRRKSNPTLKDLLNDAFDHLEYCGWGDSWERECAGDLRERMAKALGRQ